MVAGDTERTQKTGRFIFFLLSIVFLTNRINIRTYVYFRPARSRSLFILASTFGDIGGMTGAEVEETNIYQRERGF